MELNEISIETYTPGIFGALFGHGSAIVSSSASPVTIESINAKDLKKYIEFCRNRRSHNNESPFGHKHIASKQKGRIPDGVEISDQVLVLPEPPKYLTNWLLFYTYRFFSDNTSLKDGDWVNKGDILYSFEGNNIYSPVSGVVIIKTLAHSKIYEDSDFYISILLPRGEVPNISAENLYNDFYHGIAVNRKVQRTYRRLRNNGHMTDLWKSNVNDREAIAKFILNICKGTPAKYQYISAKHPNFIESVHRILENNPEIKERATGLRDLDKAFHGLAIKEYEEAYYDSAKIYLDKALSFNPENEDARLFSDKVTEKLRKAA